MRVRIEEVRGTLAAEGAASAGQLQQLLRTVTEALADVRAAQVVPAPEGRDLSNAVPGANNTGAAYEVTETERSKATNVLIDLLFTVVETPTREDRRRRNERAGRERAAPERAGRDDGADGGSDDAEESTDFGVTGYAGPE